MCVREREQCSALRHVFKSWERMNGGNRGHESVLAYTGILIDGFTPFTSTYRNTDLSWGGGACTDKRS